MSACQHVVLRKIKVTDPHWPAGVWIVYRCESCHATFQEPDGFEITREVTIVEM